MLFENNDYREDDLFSSSDSLKYGNAFKKNNANQHESDVRFICFKN